MFQMLQETAACQQRMLKIKWPENKPADPTNSFIKIKWFGTNLFVLEDPFLNYFYF